METVVIPCLRRIGNTKKYRVVQLDVVDRVVFGRSINDVDICLVSNMISRKHASLTKTADNKWQIQDHGSLNGVYVNDTRLVPNTPCVLVDKDIVRLGVPPSEQKEAEFVWQYCQAAKVCRNANKYKKEKLNPPSSLDSQKTIEGFSQEYGASGELALKRLRSSSDDSEPQPGPSGLTPSGRPPIKRVRPGNSPALASPSESVLRKMEEAEEQAKKMRAEHEAKMAEMSEQLRMKEEKYKQQEEEMKKKEEELKEMLEKQRKEMEEQLTAQQQALHDRYQQDLQQRESSLRKQLEEEHEKLISERAEIERKLKDDLSTKLGEEKKLMEQELLAEKEKLDKVIQQKECEHKMLKQQLDEARNNFNEEKNVTALKTKEQIMNNISDILETELQCSICNELFVETMTLNCSHAFCAYCLDQWMKVKKECPVCRGQITSQTRARAVDSYIDKMCEHLSAEMKEARIKLVEERKEAMKKIKEAQQAAQLAAQNAMRGSPGRRGRRGARGGRSRTRGGRGGVRNIPPPAPPIPQLPTPPVYVIGDEGEFNVVYADSVVNDNVAQVIDVETGDDDSDRDSFIVSDDESTHSDSSVEGDVDAYYGGYGSCYRCGRRGHWANGCPFF